MNHKLTFLHAVSLIALVTGLSDVAAHAQTGVAFSAGDVVVYRVGDGSTALAGGASVGIFLDEFNSAGGLVQSVAVPTTASVTNLALTASGSATSEGQLNFSTNTTTNVSYLTLTGYNTGTGTAGVATSSTIAHGVGIVGGGTIDTSTSFPAGGSFSGNNIRAAYTADGTNIYAVGGNTGVVYTTKGTVGAGTVVSGTTINLRDVVISGGQLYVSTASSTVNPSTATPFRIGVVGSGTPTTSNQTTTPLAGTSASSPAAPYAFFFASLSSANDTLYVADGSNIDKFSLVGGSYVATGKITGVTNSEGLTGSVSNGTVSLYATGGSAIYSATDSTGYNGTATGAATAFGPTAPTNEAYRGIAYIMQNVMFGSSAATPEPGALPLIAEASALVLGFGLMRRHRKA